MKPIVIIERINNTLYSFGKSDIGGISEITKALTFHNPDPYAYSPTIEKYNKHNLTFQIGMINVAIKYLTRKNIAYKLNDYSFSLPVGVEIDGRMSGKYVHQRLAVEAFYKRRFGIIVVPTRGGKTFIASEILRIFLSNNSGNFLFIVDNTTLFTQAINDMKIFFEPYGGIDIGEICSGNIDISKRVTVGMIQTIQSTLSNRCNDKDKKRMLNLYLKTLSFLCVDEIHDNCSDSRLKIYRKCYNLNYQLCLSATPYRANALVQNLKLMAWSGDVIYTIDESVLKERKVLSEYKVFMLLIDHNNVDYGMKRDDDYSDYRKHIIYENDYRNKILCRVIDMLRDMKIKTLVLFQNISHGTQMSAITNDVFISGATSGEDREKAKQEFLDKDGGILFASDIFKKGVTVSQCQVLINADGGLENAQTIQRCGRVLGTTSDKTKSLIIDFFDLYDAYFSVHSETRLNNYIKRNGEENVGILDVSNESWYDVIERWVKKWFDIQ